MSIWSEIHKLEISQHIFPKMCTHIYKYEDEYGDVKSVMIKNNVGNFKSTLNLNFSSIISNLLDEEQRNS